MLYVYIICIYNNISTRGAGLVLALSDSPTPTPTSTPVNNRDLFGHAGPLAGPLLSYIIMEMRDLCGGSELRALFSVCFPLGSDNEVNMNKEGDIF